MSKHDLTAARLRELYHYDPDTGIFTRRMESHHLRRWKAGTVAGHLQTSGYVAINIGGGIYRGHRLAWLYVHGEWPEKMLDHINRDRADNRIANLRQATNQLNAINTSIVRVGELGLPGVTRARKRFKATIREDGKVRNLGHFDTPEEAHVVSQKARAARAAALGVAPSE